MRLREIKQKFQEQPEKIQEFLEVFGFVNVTINRGYLSFARAEGSSPTGLCLYFDNPYLNFIDFSKNKKGDLFSLIKDYRHKSFYQIIVEAEKILDIEYSQKQSKVMPFFGGIYDGIIDKANEEKKPIPKLDEQELLKYMRVPSIRFLKDGINLRAQKVFGIRYDESTGDIIIPMYSPEGYPMGLKARVGNKKREKNGKYYYAAKCQKNRTLYGYSHNYSALVGADVIYVFEAEKSVMQAWSFGEYRCVAMGGSFLSAVQANLLMDLNPGKIVLAMDKGIPIEKGGVMEANVETLLNAINPFQTTKIEVMNLNMDLDVADKESPTDNGREEFKRIIEEDLLDLEEFDNELEI